MSKAESKDQWDRQWKLFHEARELSPDEQKAMLERVRQSEPELAEVLAELLFSHREAGAFLEDALAERETVRRNDRNDASDRWRGKEIGHFTIKRKIDEGGMGIVFEAVQDKPRQTVALKLLKHGIPSRSALRRFEYEAQTLARLRHPNIAYILQAGTYQENGEELPYFAMEYIPNARTITTYARELKLGTREKLAIFIKVCDAVHHGHQRGIIHRDLKPSNVLLDSSGEPKVIDFGVARATDSDLAVTTLQTDVGQLVGTLQYMSPEQCDADPHDLDTRSDVYALGVVLYELLTEQVPYDVSTVPLYEAPRVIKTTPPTRPSSFSRVVRGDLETIVLKALEKERGRRYQSAQALAQDVQHYLNDEAIEARPPSAMYQARMFAKRHRPMMFAGAAIALALVMATVVSASFAVTQNRALKREQDAQVAAERAEVKSREISQLVLQLLMQSMMPSRESNEGSSISREEMTAQLNSYRNRLETAAEPLLKSFEDDPIGRSQLLAGIAAGLRAVGLYDASEPYWNQAVAIRLDHGMFDTETLRMVKKHVNLLGHMGRDSEALPVIERVWRNRTLNSAESDNDRRALLDLRLHYLFIAQQMSLEELSDAFREVADGYAELNGRDDQKAIEPFHFLARRYSIAGEHERAVEIYEDAIRRAVQSRKMGLNHAWTWGWRGNMAGDLVELGRCEEAEVMLQKIVEDAPLVPIAFNHAEFVRTRSLWAKALACVGERERAREIWLEVLETAASSEGFPTFYGAGFKVIFAEHLVEWGEFPQAEVLLTEALPVMEDLAQTPWLARIDAARSQMKVIAEE